MFLVTRTSISSPLVSQLRCELEEGHFPSKTNNLQETTVEGVFAAGDIARLFTMLPGLPLMGYRQSLLINR